ncbi:SDR family NAD(P)-dependent oxidoreductase [Streptomyces shenzhenensis]|uniref:SDR family NAD(P)-dependent oxidoreductase n=1 Tax=Streptomyces shenzhenensis TaxID=943815 RepID=UPI00382B9FA5
MSNVTGEVASAEELCSPGYWVRHVREAVRFGDGVGAVLAQGVATVVEFGPEPVLTAMGALHPGVVESGAVFVPTLGGRAGDVSGFLTALARVHARGHQVDWTVLGRANDLARELPTYAFQHQRYWLKGASARPASSASRAAGNDAAFWKLVQEQDLKRLASGLGVDSDAPLHTVLPALGDWHQTHIEASETDGLRYRVAWERPAAQHAPEGPATLYGTWLIVVPEGDLRAGHLLDNGGLLGEVRRALTDAGAEVKLLNLAPEDIDRQTIAKLLTGLDDTPAGVVSLLALSGGEHTGPRGVGSGAWASVCLLQALLDTGWSAPRLWTLTRGAVRATESDDAPDPWQAQVWGLGRVAALEHPTLWGGLVDLPAPDLSAADGHALAATADASFGLAALLAGSGGEDQVALRADGARVRRLRPAGPDGATEPVRPVAPESLVAPERADATGRTGDPQPPAAREPWWSHGSVLITGGTGALGAHTARRLAEQGAPHLVLVSRQGPDAPGAADLRAELAAHGATVDLVSCDVTSRDEVVAVVADLAGRGAPVGAVVHTAGVAAEHPLADLDAIEFAAAVDAKVTGAVVLDEVLGDGLAAFVVYSSIAGTWGSARGGAYAAGNAFLDALVEQRRARCAAATALAWGPWSGGGMAGEEFRQEMQRRGLGPLTPRAATAALDRAVRQEDTAIVVADLDWPRFIGVFTAGRPNRLFAHFDDMASDAGHGGGAAPGASGADGTGAAQPGEWQRLLDLPLADQRPYILDLVRREAARVLGHQDADAIAEGQEFLALGFDSLAAVELRSRLSALTGLSLPSSLVFDHPTLGVLVTHLLDSAAPGGDVTASQAPGASSAASASASVATAPPQDSNDSVVGIYRRLSLQGRMQEVEAFLSSASALRTRFHSAEDLGRGAHVTTLGHGEAEPQLVCFPPFAPVDGSLQFARLANHFRGRRRVSVVTVPGFLVGEPLAASLEVLIETLAEAVLRAAGGRPYALLGYSSSGWLAQAAATCLEERGTGPAAVVLLDTYPPDSMTLEMRKAMTYEVVERRMRFTSMHYDGLTALGTYRGMFRGWQPRQLAVPTLFVRPDSCIPGSPEEPMTSPDWQATWPLDHEETEVPGDHCTMIGEFSETTAAAVDEWLSRTPGLAQP